MPKLVYECDYCGDALGSNFNFVLDHEKICEYNPINKKCASCSYCNKYGEGCCSEIQKGLKWYYSSACNNYVLHLRYRIKNT